MRLIFVRHAEPDYEHDSLTEKGFKEAEILASRTKKWKVDEVYASPMGRAQATMSPSLRNWPDIQPVTYQWLREFDHRINDPDSGEKRIPWDLMPDFYCANDELHDKNLWDKTDCMKSGDIETHFNEVKNGINELLARHGYVNRGDGCFNIENHSDETIVFFCHFGLTSVIVGYLLGISPSAIWQGFVMSPTGVTVLNSEEREKGKGAFRVQYFGDVAHLREMDEPISRAGYFAEPFQL